MGSGVEQALRLVRNVVLARVLVPEAFGSMALVLTVTSLFDSFSQVGIKEAVIQSEAGEDSRYLNGAWFFGSFRGAGLYVAGVVVAPYVAQFYARADLAPLLRVAFLALLFRGMTSPRAYVGLRNLDFRRWILVEQLGGALGILVAVALSFAWRNVWALVVGSTLEALLRMALSFVVFPFRPRWNFDRGHLRALLTFARRLAGTPILTYVFMRLDVFVVGKIRNNWDLGLYAMAAAMAHVPDLIMAKFGTPIMTPAYARLQGDRRAINTSFVRAVELMSVLGFPLVAVALLYGGSIMAVAYTPAYAAVGLVFGILCVASLVRNLGVPFASLCVAIGKPHVLRWSTAVRAVVVAACIYPATRMLGLEGAAMSVLVAVIAYLGLQVVVMKNLTGMRPGAVLRPIAVGLASAIPVLAFGWLGTRSGSNRLLEFAIPLLSLLLSYAMYGLWVRLRRSHARRQDLESR